MPKSANPEPLLEVENLKTYFKLDQGTVRAVDGASFTLHRGQTLGIVGESGSGKSVMSRSILRIVPPPGRIVEGALRYHRQTATGNRNPRLNRVGRARQDHPRHPRGRDFDGFSGAYDLAQPRPHHRQPNR